jgi:hypothetical protein
LQLHAMLVLGESDTVADEARRFVAANPLRERAWCALMLGLYRAGRQADALAAAAQLRRILLDELGLDPSPEVRDLEERILRQDPALATPVLNPTAPDRQRSRRAAETPARAETPLLPALVGRDEVLARIGATVDAAAQGRGRLLVVPAPAGLGKSSILAAIGDEVSSSGGVVLSGTGVDGGRVPALWPWVSMVRGLVAHEASAGEASPCSSTTRMGSTRTP